MTSQIRIIAVCFLFLISNMGCENVTSEDISSSADGSYTHTDSNGNITDEDSDDWRIQNYFKNEFYVTTPPYPNPTANAQVTLKVKFSASFPSSGIYVIGLNTNDLPVQVYQSSNVSFGSHTITLNLSTLSADNTLETLQGKILRLRFYDAENRLMTYGDIKFK